MQRTMHVSSAEERDGPGFVMHFAKLRPSPINSSSQHRVILQRNGLQSAPLLVHFLWVHSAVSGLGGRRRQGRKERTLMSSWAFARAAEHGDR